MNWQSEVRPDEKMKRTDNQRQVQMKKWKFEELAIRDKSRWKNENLNNWQSEVRQDMWMKIGELAVKGKSKPWLKR